MRTRGFTGIEIIGAIVALAALVAACATAFHLFTSYVDGERTAAHQAGVDETTAAVARRDNEELSAAHKQIVGLLMQNADLSNRLGALSTQLANKLREEKENERKDAEGFLARLDSGALQLREGVIEITSCDGKPATDLGGVSGAAASAVAGRAPKAACARFSRATEDFLLGRAREADDITRERNTCVEIGQRDRAELARLQALRGSSDGRR